MPVDQKKQVKANPKHRRQFFWQILLPVILAALLVIAVAVMVSLPGGPAGEKTGQWAAVSTVLLIMPLIISIFFSLIFTVLMIYLLSRIQRITPVYSRLIGLYVQIISVRVGNLLNRTTEPVFKVQGWLSGWQAFWGKFHK